MGFSSASSLAHSFLHTLLPTDPQSQILLLECLLFLTSSCQIGKGWFLTLKLIYTQSVDSEKSESYQYALLGSSEQTKVSPFLRHVYDFILAVVWKILPERRFEWARIYKTKALHFHQLLVLRLVTVLGLVCLNSEEHFSKVQELMGDAAGILPLLPQDFQLQFWFLMKGRIRTSKYFAYLFAKALESVDNQLVLVHKEGCNNAFMFLKPIVVNSSSFQQMNKI
ncbi:hypothetical protein IFM89_006044 [Coptis chinensis]|uniref:Uncharacterized protein n=1 Tax=Coptis chinensis TaxID=261450 RepID=A0A835I133_9MAGN|nr:hypothetical protein IFM89_006044 [Coptis chinensis]